MSGRGSAVCQTAQCRRLPCARLSGSDFPRKAERQTCCRGCWFQSSFSAGRREQLLPAENGTSTFPCATGGSRCGFEAESSVLGSPRTGQLLLSPAFCPLLGALRGVSMRGATRLTCDGFAGYHFGLGCLSKNNLKWRSTDQN